MEGILLIQRHFLTDEDQRRVRSALSVQSAMVIIWAFFTVIYRLLLTGYVCRRAGSMSNESSYLMDLGVGTSAFAVAGIILFAIPMIVALNFVLLELRISVLPCLKELPESTKPLIG